MLALGARCRRFESFRPDQKIQTVAFAAVLIFCLERADSNDKPPFVGVRIFHSIYRQKTINLRVSSYLCELRWACSYILGFPRRMPVGILVVVQTSHCSFSHTRIPSAYACGYPRSCSNFALLVFNTRIPSAYACGYPRSCSNFALLVFTYSDSPRPEIRKAVVIHDFNCV